MAVVFIIKASDRFAEFKREGRVLLHAPHQKDQTSYYLIYVLLVKAFREISRVRYIILRRKRSDIAG